MRRRIVIGIVAALAVVAIGVGVYVALNRIQGLEGQLNLANRTVTEGQRELQRQREEAAIALERATAAGQQASQAEQRASELALARLRSEQQATAAADTAAKSQAQLAETQGELQEIQRRRKQELDRMQEALSRVAPTRRTASGMVVELTNDSFFFDFDKANLRPQNREVLSRIAGVLLASNGYRLFVSGYADDVGTPQYNQGLSERRAESVGSYLKAAGVPPELVEVKGFGQANPRAQGTGTEARQKNRRVEIGIVDTIIQYQEVVGKR